MIFIIALSLALRLLWLDRVPIAISNDELDYVLDAKAIFLSGRDLTGEWSPFSLAPPPHAFPKAEWPALVVSPLIGPMEFSLFSARLPYVIWGVVLIVFLFLIARKLFGDQVALIAAAVAAINPWSFYFSRTAFEPPLALTFYLIAFYILISFKGWRLLFAFPFLLLAFFSYIGTKLIFLPFLLIVGGYSYFFIHKKKFTRQYLLLVLLSLFAFGWFLFSLKFQLVKSRTGELLTPFHSLVAQVVDEERRLTVDNQLAFLFSNKPIVFAKLFLEKYLGIFSADFLFLHGEARATYSMWTHGLFYYLDIIFLILGFGYLLAKNKKLWLFLVALTAIAPLPAALSTVGIEYALRAVLLYPLLILFISLGIWFLISLKKKKSHRVGIITFIVAIYFFQLVNFLNIYFFRNPIYNSEGFGFSHRVWVNYVNLSKQDSRRVLVMADDVLGSFKQYLFYSDVYDRERVPLVQKIIAENDYRWENIHFLRDCPEELKIGEDDLVILLSDTTCLGKEKDLHWLSIARLGDGGEVFRIINDQICHQFDLNRYPTGIKLSDFKVEALSPERFCRKFVTDL